MHEGLRRRVRELERRSAADGSFVLMPLPGKRGESVRIPRPFAEWLARKGQEQCSAGRYFNMTDQRWENCKSA
jgi:hypothetical protein